MRMADDFLAFSVTPLGLIGAKTLPIASPTQQ
jgi:hypothetical protein